MTQSLPQPNRIDVALESIHYCHRVESGLVLLSPSAPPMRIRPRALTAPELGLRRTSLEVLRLYVAGEIESLGQDEAPPNEPTQPGLDAA